MTRLAAKMLSRAGLAMLILCIGCRFIIGTESAMMADNLAIISSAALTVVALLYLKFAPNDDAGRSGTARSSSGTARSSSGRSHPDRSRAARK